MREKVIFCWPKVVIFMKPSRQKVEQCEGTVEQIFLLYFSVMVRGTMTPDTYKPIFRVSVLPIDKKADGFQMYSSQNCLHWSASGKSTFLSALCLTLIFTLSNKCLLM